MRATWIAATSVALLAVGTAFADDNKSQGGVTPLSEYRSHSLVNTAGDKLGAVVDVVIDTKGNLHYVIIDRGGVLADKYVAIPCAAVRSNNAENQCTIDMTTEQFHRAPTFLRANYHERWTDEWCQQVHQFFGVERDQSPSKPEGTDFYYLSQLIGATVQNKDNKTLADIDDLITLDGKRVAYFVLGSGGILNIGEEHFAAPFKALQLKKGEKGSAYAVLSMPQKVLEKAPKLKKDDYSELRDPEYVRSVEEFFKGEKQEG